jgi:predicted N-acetyltransferase YhbS
VPTLEIRPLSELRGEAADLLAERFARQRAAEPLLPEVSDFEKHLPEDGLVATRGGEVVAYLGGALDGDLARWGFAGHAAREPEALRDLFAVQADALGVQRFMLTVPAGEADLVDVWFRLAFGCQAVWAVREPAAFGPIDFGGAIRDATLDDIEAMLDFDELLYEHQGKSPSFSGLAAPSRDELRSEEIKSWDDSAILANLLAEVDGRVVGWLVLYKRPEGDLRVPENNVDLAFAATRPDVRGGGAGLALTHHALSWAHERGFTSMTVDFRSVNLLSSLYRSVP